MANPKSRKRAMRDPFRITVYLDNGVYFYYDVAAAAKAREHSAAIVATGYRHNDGRGEYEHYPPHRISKVKVSGAVVPTKYPDKSGGT